MGDLSFHFSLFFGREQTPVLPTVINVERGPRKLPLDDGPNGEENVQSAPIVGSINARTQGARFRDPQKYVKDAQLLEKELLKDPNNSRYVFYLGLSYENAKTAAMKQPAPRDEAALRKE